MDISGVDVDFLSDKEILELCKDIVDYNNNEIFVLNGVDVDNLSDNKVQEFYDDFMQKQTSRIDFNDKTDFQVLDENYNTVDLDSDEIMLSNGFNINTDNLSDDEILSLYDEISDEGDLLVYQKETYKSTLTDATDLPGANTYGSTRGAKAKAGMKFYKYGKDDGNPLGTEYAYFNLYCADPSGTSYNCRIRAIAAGKGACYFQCTGYKQGIFYCTVKVNTTYNAYNVSSQIRSNPYSEFKKYAPTLCK